MLLAHHSIDSHTTAHRPARPGSVAVVVVRHLRHVVIREFLFLALQLPSRDVGFQAAAEVGGTHAGVDDGEDDEDDGDDREGG